MDNKLDSVDHFSALEKLVVIGRGLVTVQSFQGKLSPGVIQALSCVHCSPPLISMGSP